MSAFRPVDLSEPFPRVEERVLALWDEIGAFEKSVEQHPAEQAYVFYDGPPFATGKPHYGHLVASTLKDIVPRYWTMRGHRVERRFGWDTHGLPIEMLMEKELGLSGPASVREYGVDRFNEACRGGVLRYTQEWRKVIGRLGRWVDFDNDYKTMDPSFMESVWWVFAQLWEKGLIYQDFRVMPYSWRLSTSLSNFEANLDYRDVQDPAITVAMPAVDSDDVLLVWTTTPWTLPSNLAIAVGEDIDYVRARKKDDARTFVVAKERVQAILGKKAEILGEPFKGSELVGTRYVPLFDFFAGQQEAAHQVILAPHVTTEDGTGLVHMAPDFGEEDYNASREAGISVVQSVDDEGSFGPEVTTWAGRNVKEADPEIIRAIKEMGRLVRHDTIQHSYPYCWRSGTPLIYKALPAWFVKVTDLRDRMVEHNTKIHWVPEAVGSGRFGNWLADARDWNISRNRFWGTPIPIWTCANGHHACLGSIAELEQRTGATVDDLHPHKIDHLTFSCSECGAESRRIADVFDCWFESGSMPYAQGHYPFEDKEAFEAAFPAKFIAEGLDQTRGWFYTLLVLSTALFDQPPFLNCVVNGMVLAEDGAKMSKSKQNYPPPDRILDEYGADALRAYLIDSPVVRAEPLKFSETGVRDVARTVIIPLRNALSFFVQYANIDGWNPTDGLGDGSGIPTVGVRPELDRWLISHLQSLVGEVNEQMELYQLYNVVPAVVGFVDDLTNWYIRLSRRRFWRSADSAEDRADKAAAYATLYEALVLFSRILAPFLPFLAEEIYQQLVVGPECEGEASVHLTAYPLVHSDVIDRGLELRVSVTRDVVRMGRRLRERHRLKTRQPLARLTLVHHDPEVQADLEAMTELIASELNVVEVVVTDDGGGLATVSCKPNFKNLGRRYGKQMKEAAGIIGGFGAAEFNELDGGGTIEVLGQPITADDVLVVREPRGDVVIETEGALVVAFDTELSDALIQEGIAREVVSLLQKLRKDTGLEVTDRIRVSLTTDDPALVDAVEAKRGWIAEEVLAEAVEVTPGSGSESISTVKGDHSLTAEVARA